MASFPKVLKILKCKIIYWFVILKITLRIIEPSFPGPSKTIWNYGSSDLYIIDTIVWGNIVYQFKPKNNVWVPIIDEQVEAGMKFIFEEGLC